MSVPVCVYDFTLKKTICSKDELKDWLKDLCKKWVFQLERGESGYEHYQGRLSLKVKARLDTLLKKCKWKEIHLSQTSSQNSGNDFYVTKEDTRIDGPWSSEDKEKFIPWDVEEITELRPWQQIVFDSHDQKVKRIVNVIIDTKGNNGKTTLIRCMCVHGYAKSPPFCNDFKDLMRMVCDMGDTNCYLIDMPRAINKEKLYQFYAGIEKIKDGYAYDDRYKFTEKFFNPPVVWVFTNKCPELNLLSKDRWRLWTIEDDNLIEYDPKKDLTDAEAYSIGVLGEPLVL